MRVRSLFALAVAALFLASCQSGRKSALGFHLPDGDPEAGKTAFVAMKCYSCHRVEGAEGLPQPVSSPPVPIVLGGEEHRQRTDGELMTSIVHPSYRIAVGYPRDQVTAPDGSTRMGDFTEAMSVRQMVDIVAFLHSHYTFVPPQPVR